MTKLYELAEQMRSLERLADESDESLDQAIRDTFDALTAEFDDKAVALVKVTENMQADVAALDAEINRLQARKKARQSRIQWLRDYLRDNMQASGINKIECPLFTISLRKPAQKVEIEDAGKLPSEYVIVQDPVPDKRKILADLKAGKDVPGAHIVDGKVALVIK